MKSKVNFTLSQLPEKTKLQKGNYPINRLQENTVAREVGKGIFTSSVANVPLSRYEIEKLQLSAKIKVIAQADEQQKKFSSIWKQ